MYLLIGVWGSAQELFGHEATLMLMGGSAFLMLGLIGIYYHSAPEGMPADHGTFLRFRNNAISHGWQYFLFPMTFVGFGVLGAMFPSTHGVPTVMLRLRRRVDAPCRAC